MLSHAQKFFSSTHFKGEDERRLARLLSLFLLAGLAFDLIALAVIGLFSSNPAPHIPLLLALLVVFLAPLGILHFGHLRIAARMLIYPLWLMITLLVIASGGTSSINMAGIILVIFVAGILVGKKDGLLVAALSVSTIIVILLLNIIGLLPSPVIIYPPITEGAVSIIYLVVAALLLYLALNNLSDALRKIKEREQENRIITEEALAGVYIIQEGRIVYANPTLQRITGYEEHELIGKPLNDIIHPADRELVRANVQRRMDDPSLRLAYAVRGVRKDGSTIYCEVMGRSAEYQGKQAIIGTLLDMTEHVKAEAAVRTSEQLYRNLVEKVKDVIFTLSPDGTIISLNPAFEQITGWSPEEWLGASFAKLIHPRDLPLALKLLRSSLDGKDLRPFELQVMTKSGDVVYGEFLVTPQVQEGQLVSILGIGREITDRKKAELERDRLLQAEHEQRQLAETLAEVTLSLASKHNLTEVLDEILHQTRNIVPYRTANIVLLDGDKLNTVRWQGYEDYDSERFIANLKQNLTDYPVEKETVRTGLPIAIYDTHKDQRWRMMPETSWIRSFLVVPIRLQETVLGLLRLDGDTPGEFTSEDGLRLSALANAAAIALDSARLQDEIEDQALQLQQILDTVRDGIVLLDANQIIRLANPAARHYLEVLASVKVGQKLNHLGDLRLEDLLEPAKDGRPWHELAIPEGQRYFAVT
ncbi:MAG: PAS domain S-box protein, partial [Chloroflexota bacterium]